MRAFPSEIIGYPPSEVKPEEAVEIARRLRHNRVSTLAKKGDHDIDRPQDPCPRPIRPAALLALALVLPVAADEGMWLFNMPPKDILLKKYGFTVTPELMEHLRLASISFGGASGSFVSPDGLVLTNHHVGRGAVQNLSTKDRDLMKTGFYARTRAEELKCPAWSCASSMASRTSPTRSPGPRSPA